jgi:hypothetical protein
VRTLKHRELAAKAAYTQADEQYKSTVLTAFQNVADTLHAIEQYADGMKAAASVKDAASVTVDLTKKQLDSGYANYLALSETSLPAGLDQSGAGSIESLCTYCRVVSSFRRRLVEPPGFVQELNGQTPRNENG